MRAADPSREVEPWDSPVNRAKEGKRDPPCPVGQSFLPDEVRKPKRVAIFFSPPWPRKPVENSLKAAGAADYFALQPRGDQRGGGGDCDQRIRSR